MLLLFVTAPSVPDAQECLALLNAWHSLLRVRNSSCDLFGPALLRLDGVLIPGLDNLIELSPAALQTWTEMGPAK